MSSTSIYCPHCHKYTLLSQAKGVFNESGRRVSFPAVCQLGDNQTWWIGMCNACYYPCLVLNDGETVYPAPRPQPTNPNVPPDLAADINEAKLCLSTSCYRAAATMARRAVQRACIQKGAKKDKLHEQIGELFTNGSITQDIKTWATAVRHIGNDGAHPDDTNPVTKDDATDCVELAEAFLDVLFVKPAQAAARLAARGKP